MANQTIVGLPLPSRVLAEPLESTPQGAVHLDAGPWSGSNGS